MIDNMCRPVSPKFVCPTLRFGCQGCKDGACKQKTVNEEEISIADIARGDYIVGHYSDAEGPIPMKAPREMTPDEWARHVVTHLPYNCSCPHCVAGKKPNLHHRRSKTERRIPHLVADY